MKNTQSNGTKTVRHTNLLLVDEGAAPKEEHPNDNRKLCLVEKGEERQHKVVDRVGDQQRIDDPERQPLAVVSPAIVRLDGLGIKIIN